MPSKSDAVNNFGLHSQVRKKASEVLMNSVKVGHVRGIGFKFEKADSKAYTYI
jgi:hypothetical protein